MTSDSAVTTSSGRGSPSLASQRPVHDRTCWTRRHAELEKDLTGENIDRIRSRAEDLLWAPGERRVRWRDLEEQSICNVRWTWLPSKGLDDLRKRATSTGDWKDDGDGYIEKGPFPPAKTSVKAVTKQRDDATGKATIDVAAIGAGPRAQIYYSASPNVSVDSSLVEDSVIERDDTVLWFLAVDPDGKFETGDPLMWTNTLSITYQPTEVMGTRTVTLDVRPRGTIRWNMDGTNAREGKIYTGPIEVPGNAECTLYTYAEDAGITVTKQFTIRAVTGGEATIDKTKPAIVLKRIKLPTTSDTFATLRAAKKSKVLFGHGVTITVGKGDSNAVTRFGPGTTLSAEALEKFIIGARAAISDEEADVEVGFGEMALESGQDLQDFLQEVEAQIKVEPSEVQQ